MSTPPAGPQGRWKPVHYVLMWFIGVPAAVGALAIYLSLTLYHERAAKRMEMDAMIKQDLIQRGYTPAEIEQVLRANSEESYHSSPSNDYMRNQLIRDLRKQGMKAEDIERVVRAAYPQVPPTPTVAVQRRATAAEPVETTIPPGEAREAMPFTKN